MVPALLQILRVLPGRPEALAGVLAGVDRAQLVTEAVPHGLQGYLFHQLQTAGLLSTFEPATTLRKHAASLGASVFKIEKLLDAVLEAFAARGIEPVLLKGFGFAKRYYPEPYARPMGDVDVL